MPRLMKGQGLIVGTGAIGYPSEYEASDPKMLAQRRSQQAHHGHLDLRSPRHPGGRVGPVPR